MFCAEPPRCGAVVAAVGEGIYFGFYKTDGPGKLAYGEVIKWAGCGHKLIQGVGFVHF